MLTPKIQNSVFTVSKVIRHLIRALGFLAAHTALQWYALFYVAVYLNSYLQPNDDIDRDTYLNPKVGSNICARECVAGENPKICYYKWTVENYATISQYVQRY
jgi:hypothetical protein